MKTKILKHNETCTCDDCENRAMLVGMKYIAFTEHRGYMEVPTEFDTYEEAVKYIKENRSFYDGYIVYGKLLPFPIPPTSNKLGKLKAKK